MKSLAVCLTFLMSGCATLSERIAAYDDKRLCAELGRGSAHSKRIYVEEAARRGLLCTPKNEDRGGDRLESSSFARSSES